MNFRRLRGLVMLPTLLLAACGESVSAHLTELTAIPPKWFAPRPTAAGAVEAGGATPPRESGKPRRGRCGSNSGAG